MIELGVSSLNVTRGDTKGEVDIQWDSLDTADLYMVQYSVNGQKESWKLADIINESSYKLRGLKTAKTYIFRVAAVSTNKQGPWSEPVKKRII